MVRVAATMVAGRMPTTMMARATIEAVAIAPTTVGKEEARRNPGLFFARSNEQGDDRQQNQGRNAEVHHCEDAAILFGVTFGKFPGHEICKWIRHRRPRVKERKGSDLRIAVKSRNSFGVRRFCMRGSRRSASMVVACE